MRRRQRFLIISLFLVVIAVPVMVNQSMSQEKLKPFTSDGCSVFPDGTFSQNQLWLTCCRRHDLAYWKGGTYQERKDADFALKECVSKVGEDEVALLMLAGVRVGGSPLFPTSYRWGYGWPYPRLYGPLTTVELMQVKERIKEVGQ